MEDRNRRGDRDSLKQTENNTQFLIDKVIHLQSFAAIQKLMSCFSC